MYSKRAKICVTFSKMSESPTNEVEEKNIREQHSDNEEENLSKRRKLEEPSEIGPSIPVSFPQEEEEPKSSKRKVTPQIIHNLSALPSSIIYEKSYLHKDVISQVRFAGKTEFLITGSRDGHVKFWKKQLQSIEFVKDYLAHTGIVWILFAFILRS